jgi:hypothetical protein
LQHSAVDLTSAQHNVAVALFYPPGTIGPSLGHQLSYLHFVLLMLELEM